MATIRESSFCPDSVFRFHYVDDSVAASRICFKKSRLRGFLPTPSLTKLQVLGSGSAGDFAGSRTNVLPARVSADHVQHLFKRISQKYLLLVWLGTIARKPRGGE